MTWQPGISQSGLAALADGAVLSPFTQLRKLLASMPAGHAEPIDLTIGEPREPMPEFLVEKLMEAVSGLRAISTHPRDGRTARRDLGLVGPSLRGCRSA